MNRLGAATSPYLLQHRDNPVHWWEWSDAAFAEAKRLDRPVVLSIGYAACHWCHVMAHESFEDEGVAAVMNALFVNVKVGREERPDVDHLYMSALHALGEQGGWPLTMFLTPDREPFWGGTYFPKEARYGKPGFADLLRHVARIYREEPARIGHNASALRAHLSPRALPAGAAPGQGDFLAAAAQAATAFDPVDGGVNGAPKFPNAPILNMLWRAGARDPRLRAPVLVTLRRMALGGIQDHLGGGFARYSVDGRWLVPHFEKMLYDNAQLLELYALAAAETGDALFRDAATGIVAWLTREMTLPAGGFASSLDADSEGEEGLFYVWKRSEIESALGGGDAIFFARFYDVTDAGNFEGRNIPNRLDGPEPTMEEAQRLARMRERLIIARARRIRPGCDDKVLADWNGMMIAALARAGALLHEPDWIAVARRAYRFVRESVRRDGRLAHSWRGDVGVWPAFALDHAAMALAAVTLAEADDHSGFLGDARADLDWLAKLHADPASHALAMTAADAGDLIARPAPTNDDAVPNANGVYAEALIRCALMSFDDDMLMRVDKLFGSLSAPMRGQLLAHASLWSALDLRLNGAQILIAGAGGALREAARAISYPNRIVASFTDPQSLPESHPAKALAASEPATARALICIGENCSLPLTDPGLLAQAVTAIRSR